MSRLRLKDLILYEDDTVITINKPAHVSSLHERFESRFPSVIELCKAENPGYTLCHRLDRETSGVMLIAKDQEAYRFITLQFEKRTVHKIYHALVAGSLEIKNLRVDLPIYTDSKRRVKISRKDGKPSVTEFNTLKQYKHFTLLACSPLTGRLHQIRVHAASQNMPLVSDILYGGNHAFLSGLKKKHKSPEGEEAKPMISRVALHAFSIEFESPAQGRIIIEAPYPKDFEVLIKLLERYDALT